ncbi:PsbB mRNA maturation factor Mbb1, chloroplastic [Porphyridium purpureum]|uniref:PsbB mRNA maturation factor Mbb1, chloroplastic n=1 Tax=Porphyridium purpureum TaxID=35688 RepID=A0A5J4Z6U8_PORPP|nr:PsbB mRNA maturation factor Mbb1, chloroplastic [Porphyridium purpureum]|eukprot:POR3996..scf295_1
MGTRVCFVGYGPALTAQQSSRRLNAANAFLRLPRSRASGTRCGADNQREFGGSTSLTLSGTDTSSEGAKYEKSPAGSSRKKTRKLRRLNHRQFKVSRHDAGPGRNLHGGADEGASLAVPSQRGETVDNLGAARASIPVPRRKEVSADGDTQQAASFPPPVRPAVARKSVALSGPYANATQSPRSFTPAKDGVLRGNTGFARSVSTRGGAPFTRKNEALIQEQRQGWLETASESYLVELAEHQMRYSLWNEARSTLTQCTKSHPRFAKAWIKLAMLERQLKNVGAAKLVYEDAIKFIGHHRFLISSYGELLRSLGEDEEALRVYLAGCENRKFADQFLIQALAEMYAKLGCVREARTLWRRSAQLDPSFAPSMTAWANMEYELCNDPERARALLAAGATAFPFSAPILLAWAELEEKLGCVDAARELFAQAMLKHPRHVKLLLSAGSFEFRQGQLDRARTIFTDAYEQDTDHAMVQHWALNERVAHPACVSYVYQIGTKLYPGAVTLWIDYASLEHRRGNAERCYEIHAQAVSSVPETERHRILRTWAKVLLQEGEYSRAQQALHRALQLKMSRTQMIKCKHLLADVETSLGNEAKAKQLLLDIVTNLDQSNIAAMYKLGMICINEGELIAARDTFRKCVMLNSREPGSLAALGDVEFQLGNVDAARKLLAGSLILDRGRESTWNTWIRNEERVGNFDVAKSLQAKYRGTSE